MCTSQSLSVILVLGAVIAVLLYTVAWLVATALMQEGHHTATPIVPLPWPREEDEERP